MAYVVTDACIKDFLCVDECAVDAIEPKKSDPKAGQVSQVFINPDLCIECGACAATCAQDAIFAGDGLPAGKEGAADKNAAYFK